MHLFHSLSISLVVVFSSFFWLHFQRDVLVAFLTSAAGSIELGDSAEAHEPKIFGSSTGSRAHGQKGSKKGVKKGGKQAGDAQTFRLRKLSITANDAAELEGVLEEIKAEDEVCM